ncbi:hypothetical protein [Vreelandella olivaria]|uniref:hypothetical protein n=1 Tax=Vreelandella olivaria TaxID=390919 RepID=UPI00201F395F|nr:hypothetical protein [Halomonas olivaria]
MTVTDIIFGFSGIFAGAIGLVLLFIASIVALFKIDEADHYFGEWDSLEQLYLKGLPFSLWRMTHYGFKILFRKSKFVQRVFMNGKPELIDQAPVGLKRLLVWLYAGGMLCLIFAIAMAGAGMLLSDL